MRNLPRPREYLAEHGYDTVLLLFLLGADLTWLLLVEVNFPFTVCAVLWSLFIACYDNPGKPNELVVGICVAGWVLGNALWTMFDFAEDGKRVMGTLSPAGGSRTLLPGYEVDAITTERLVDGAGLCFAAVWLLALVYYVFLRTSTGHWVALERSIREQEDPYGTAREEGKTVDGASGNGGLGEDSVFEGTAFLPNVFGVTSWVEYEGLASFLWITKDLLWWLSVEKQIPGADVATCVVAVVLILHHLDMLANAVLKGDVMGVANLWTLLLWVASMTLWALGEMYQPDEVCAPGPLWQKPAHPDNLRFVASWIMAMAAACFILFWTAYLALFATFDDGLSFSY